MDEVAHKIAELANELHKHQGLCNLCWQGLFCPEKHRLRIQMNDLERERRANQPPGSP